MKSDQIYNYIERLGSLLRADARKTGADSGLQPVQVEAMHFLSVCNRYSDTPMAVTDYLGLTKGTVSQTLKVLEKKGLIEKASDPDDKRVTHLKVTEEGQRVLSTMIPSALFRKACEQLTDNSQERLAGDLNALLVTLQQLNGMKSFGVCGGCRFNEKKEDGAYFCQLTKEPLSATDVTLICREHELK